MVVSGFERVQRCLRFLKAEGWNWYSIMPAASPWLKELTRLPRFRGWGIVRAAEPLHRVGNRGSEGM